MHVIPSPVSTPGDEVTRPGRERNEVRTIFEDVEEDIDIPIYDIPLPQEVRTP